MDRRIAARLISGRHAREAGGGTIADAALERVKGIEPSYAAWEAAVLPLNYTRIAPLHQPHEFRFLPHPGLTGQSSRT
jgi:hypothetical protein